MSDKIIIEEVLWEKLEEKGIKVIGTTVATDGSIWNQQPTAMKYT